MKKVVSLLFLLGFALTIGSLSIVSAAENGRFPASTTKFPPTNITGNSSETLTTVQIQSETNSAQTDLFVTFGQPFFPGNVPAGSTVKARLTNGTAVPLQVDAKATHKDGSLRHVVLTAKIASLPANETITLELFADTPEEATPPVAAGDVLATSFDTTISLDVGGTIYTASARDLLTANASQTWIAGPMATEWILSAPFKDGSDQPHPHLTARFNVRAYQDADTIQVDTIVENNWAYEPDPQNFTYDATVTVDGQGTVLNLNDLTHYRQARWHKTFWWGTAPEVHIIHDTAYLMKSGAVPNYESGLIIPEADLAAMAAEWSGEKTELMNVGLPVPDMPRTGGRRDIGPLPRWTARYLLSMDPRAKTSTLGTAELAGSWSIHYRDKDTDLPVTLIDYPYMTILGRDGDTYNPGTGQQEKFPDCGGDCTTPNDHDTAHQPSLAYVPYLVTGSHYFLEELQFWANYNMFESNPHYRDFEKGLFHPQQVRGQGWSLRTLGYTAYITPDDHPLKQYFVDRVGFNIDWYQQRYVDNPDANQLGFAEVGYAVVFNGERGVGPWQDDFLSWSIGNLVDLGFTEAYPILQWKSQFAVGRMVGTGYCWISGAPYHLNVRAAKDAPFYTTFAEAYDATADVGIKDLPCAGQAMADELGLSVGEMTGYSHSPTGYPSNMQPALATAVQSGIPNAQAAWDQFMSRTVKPDYSRGPQFAIAPRTVIPLNLDQTVYLPTVVR